MGRPKGGTNINHIKEEKLALVLRNLEGETLVSLERETGISMAKVKLCSYFLKREFRRPTPDKAVLS